MTTEVSDVADMSWSSTQTAIEGRRRVDVCNERPGRTIWFWCGTLCRPCFVALTLQALAFESINVRSKHARAQKIHYPERCLTTRRKPTASNHRYCLAVYFVRCCWTWFIAGYFHLDVFSQSVASKSAEIIDISNWESWSEANQGITLGSRRGSRCRWRLFLS